MPSVVCSGYVALILATLAGIIVGMVVFGSGLVFGKRVSNGKAWRRNLSIAIVTALIVSCAAFWILGDALMSSYYPPSPRRKPSKQDVVGIWQLTQDSLEGIQDGGYEISTHNIEFRADGTFMMTNLPEMVLHFYTPSGKYVSGLGRWSIERDTNLDWSIWIRFTELNSDANNLRTYLYLYGKEPPYLIYNYIGDPDEGRILTLEKRLENR